MMAITRRPAPRLADGERTYLNRTPIDTTKAEAQHAAYVDLLRAWGLAVTTLPAEPTLPDSVFVEDAAIVLPEVALVTPLGATSRSAEADLMERALGAVRAQPVVRLAGEARIEGGDVLRLGRHLFIGQGPRTDQQGLDAVARIVADFGYTVTPVRVTGCLHLKTACTALSDETLLINPDWVDAAPFDGLDLLPVDPREPFAANVLRAKGHLAIASSFPRTAGRIRRRGFDVGELDISEFLKAEAGLTCMSVLGAVNTTSEPLIAP